MYKFNTLKYAVNFQNQAKKAMIIILGDDGLFWVVTLAQGEKLLRAGYCCAQ